MARPSALFDSDSDNTVINRHDCAIKDPEKGNISSFQYDNN